MTNEQNVVRQGVPLDQALVKRWAELFAYVLAEFHRDHRDATAKIEGDYSTLDIRIHKLHRTENDWVARRLTVDELRTTDLRALAKRLYASANELPGPQS